MHSISLVLATLYAAAMILAVVSTRKELGMTLLVVNVIFACLLILGYQWSIFLWIGIIGLILSAILNGYRLNSRVKLPHLAIRFCLSILIIWLYYN